VNVVRDISGVKDNSTNLRLEEIEFLRNPFQLFKNFYNLYEKTFILESLVGPKELSEMTVIGFGPELVVTCSSTEFSVFKDKKIIFKAGVKDPLLQLKQLLVNIKDFRFRYIGGAVGYISYDAIRFWEDLPVLDESKNKKGFALMEFGIYRDGILFNHKDKKAFYFCTDKNSRFDIVKEQLRKTDGEPETRRAVSFTYSKPTPNIKRQDFIKMVKKSHKLLYDGDIFQVVLSKSLKFKVKGNILRVYESLREINPSPYMYFLSMKDRCIIGSSPEMLLRITGDYIETFPIAGTRPIVGNEKRNQAMQSDLLNDKKEIAEHTMLVDLARNDIGRICKYGSVLVSDLMTVKRFSHVQHIVSHVTGRLRDDCDSFQAIKSLFPAGTVTGAPKVRAMQIIDELEPDLRGPYAGALGYFSFNGSADFAIAIRSLFVKKDIAYIQSGAGIVIDSVPAKEWTETEQKANALLSAIKKAKFNGKQKHESSRQKKR
jgi:anthranilate synthase component 1